MSPVPRHGVLEVGHRQPGAFQAQAPCARQTAVRPPPAQGVRPAPHDVRAARGQRRPVPRPPIVPIVAQEDRAPPAARLRDGSVPASPPCRVDGLPRGPQARRSRRPPPAPAGRRGLATKMGAAQDVTGGRLTRPPPGSLPGGHVTPSPPGAACRGRAPSASRRGAPGSRWGSRDVRRSCRCRLTAGRRRARAAGRPSSRRGVQGRGGWRACPVTGSLPSRPAPPADGCGDFVGTMPPSDGRCPSIRGCRPETSRGGRLGAPADPGAPEARAPGVCAGLGSPTPPGLATPRHRDVRRLACRA